MSILNSIPARTSAVLSSICITEKTLAEDIQEGRKEGQERQDSFLSSNDKIPFLKKLQLNIFLPI